MLRFSSILLSRPYVVWVYGMYVFEVGLSLVLAVRVAGSTLADAKRTSMTNTYCMYTVLRYAL